MKERLNHYDTTISGLENSIFDSNIAALKRFIGSEFLNNYFFLDYENMMIRDSIISDQNPKEDETLRLLSLINNPKNKSCLRYQIHSGFQASRPRNQNVPNTPNVIEVIPKSFERGVPS